MRPIQKVARFGWAFMLASLLLTACSPASLASAGRGLVNLLANSQGQAAAPPAEAAATDLDVLAQVGLPEVAAQLGGSLEQIYADVNPSVVHIQVRQGFGGGQGSGFVWDSQGHIVTNNHVVAGAEAITVIFSDDSRADAELVGADPASDLAVLRVDVPADRLRPVTLADSTSLRVGQVAIAIGNPFGQEGTMTIGIISALGRMLPVEGDSPFAPSYNIPDVIQTDAAINPGNSGGVLLNDQGQVIGVTTAIISPSRSSSGIGLAIPAAIVERVAPALIRDGEYAHPYIGISGGTLTPELAEAMGLPADQRGALVAEVSPDSPAAAAGLQGSGEEAEIDGQPVQVGGDVIVAVDDAPIESMDDLIVHLARHTQVGQTVELTVLRDGEQQILSLTLAARPETDQPAVQQAEGQPEAGADRPRLGIFGAALDAELVEASGLPADQQGVLVIQVQPGSPAAEAGLQGGDEPGTLAGRPVLLGGDVITAFNGQAVSSVEDLVARLEALAAGDEVSLTILRDGEELQLEATLGE
ncbi:MAG: trypsin-like peptidase domain-containing protein [Candidatus Promineifilaceae bacterium]